MEENRQGFETAGSGEKTTLRGQKIERNDDRKGWGVCSGMQMCVSRGTGLLSTRTEFMSHDKVKKFLNLNNFRNHIPSE